ncbi:hypothetical protein PCI56_19220 [Plesiomonas shigelloides subsp. oncorhynchi]|nr:hypothetical protein [Plesiomonas shigelloides]
MVKQKLGQLKENSITSLILCAIATHLKNQNEQSLELLLICLLLMGQKLLNIAYPIRMPADYLTGYIQRNKLHAYGVEPCCVSITNVPSEIDSISKRNYGTHIENE